MTNQTPESVIAEVIEYHADTIGSHWDGCYKHHAVCLAVKLRDMLREPGVPEPSESERESVINAVLNRLDEMNNGEISYGVYSELHDLVSSIPALPPPAAVGREKLSRAAAIGARHTPIMAWAGGAVPEPMGEVCSECGDEPCTADAELAALALSPVSDKAGVARPLDSEEVRSWDTQSETDEAESIAHTADSPATTRDTKMQTQPSYATGTRGTEGTTQPGGIAGESTGLTEAKTRTRPECEHCPDGHRVHQPWGAFVASERDSDGQPTHIVVMPTAGAHVAESDAEWIRDVLNGRFPPPARDEWEYRCTNEQNSVPLSVSPESHREHCSGVIERRRKAGPWEPLPQRTACSRGARPERRERDMSDLHDARVEAAGEAVYDEVVISTYLTMSDCERIAEVALAAADAVVTVEGIAAALHGDECPDDPDEGESCSCDGNHYMRQGEIVHALLRGGEDR